MATARNVNRVMSELLEVTGRLSNQDLTFFVDHDIHSLEFIIVGVCRERGADAHPGTARRSTYRVAEEAIFEAKFTTEREILETVVQSICDDMLRNVHEGEEVVVNPFAGIDAMSPRNLRAAKKLAQGALKAGVSSGTENSRAVALKGYLGRRK